MLEMFRARNHDVFMYIRDKLPEIIDDYRDIEHEVQKMLLQYASHPDQTYIWVIFDDAELKGFLYGYLQDLYGWIQFAWCRPEIPRVFKLESFERFTDFVADNGLKEIRMATQRRNLEAWKRLYDFEEYAVLMRKEL